MQQGTGLKIFLAITAAFLVGVIGYFTLFLIPQNYLTSESPVVNDENKLDSQQESLPAFLGYVSNEFGFSFNYPSDYKIVRDEKESDYHVIQLEKVEDGNVVTLRLRINSGRAFGTDAYYVDKYYILEEDDNGKVSIESENEVPIGKQREEAILRSSYETSNGNDLKWVFKYDDEAKGLEEEFEEILSSLVISSSVNLYESGSYKNEEFGIYVELPSEYQLVGELRGLKVAGLDSLVRFAFGQEKNFSSGYDGEMFIFIFEFPDISYRPGEQDKIIADIGKQFSDRKEERNNIKIDGISATRVVVSTNERENWESESIFLQYFEKLFWIHNGAIPQDTFKNFYESLEFERTIEASKKYTNDKECYEISYPISYFIDDEGVGASYDPNESDQAVIAQGVKIKINKIEGSHSDYIQGLIVKNLEAIDQGEGGRLLSASGKGEFRSNLILGSDSDSKSTIYIAEGIFDNVYHKAQVWNEDNDSLKVTRILNSFKSLACN